MAARNAKIQIEVDLDEQQIPEKILWTSLDQGPQNQQEAKAILISFFDKDSLDTMKLDLWTKEMQVMEMDRFMFHTLNAMADTYRNATNNSKLANDFKSFANYFGEQIQNNQDPS
ncbi:MAG TPA: gliding motility protein GldC [Saprospiraceae bacterium]|nr:gliding motility protein GldC [Saprospiraceae bacterium]